MNARRARTRLLPALAGLGLAWAGVGQAAADNSLRAAAEQAVRAHFALPGSRVVAKADAIDARLQPRPCNVPLRADLGEAVKPRPRLSVPVSCPQAPGWTVRVPVQLQLFRQVLVTTRPLLRGDGLNPGDLRLDERDITRLGYGYVGTLEQVAGRNLARALPAGSVLTPAALGGRDMVRAGDRVQLVAQLNGIVVRADGIALGSGDNGARLRVRNESSGRVVDAMVMGPGEVLALP